VDEAYDILEEMEPGIARVLARNPSAFTYTGTQTWFVGTGQVAIIDPGPDIPGHVDALVDALGDRDLVAILCTHTHRDHSPAAAPLAKCTGAPIVGCAALALETLGPRADASFDGEYSPDRLLEDGESLDVDGRPLIAVATPGHTSNHLCFAWGDVLFTGDHVMGWSTTVVVPPDGDMAAYMNSLEKLRARDDRIHYPAHGPPVTNPGQYLRSLVGHRMQRERQILRLVTEKPSEIHEIVSKAYPGLDRRLTAAAGGSVHAHLLDLERRGLVERDGDIWSEVRGI
jgi:glyoxylase-like metal-dependent hydrolase (beta-lactamase superfamily II)